MDSKQAAQEIYMLSQQIKALETKRETLVKEHFGKRAIDTYAEGPFRVNVMRNARFDPNLAKTLLSEEEYESILETKPSSVLAKELLSPVEYRMLQKDAEYRKVSITLPDEEN